MNKDIDKTCFIADSAVVIGKVRLSKNCSVFPNAVLRGDENEIIIDECSNVQDCAVIHVDSKNNCIIGKNVSIGHGAIIHGAKIEDNVIVGMNATVMNGARIKKGSIIGACALVSENKEIPANSLVVGIPGKVIKQDKDFEKNCIKNAEVYVKLAKEHKEGKFKID